MPDEFRPGDLVRGERSRGNSFRGSPSIEVYPTPFRRDGRSFQRSAWTVIHVLPVREPDPDMGVPIVWVKVVSANPDLVVGWTPHRPNRVLGQGGYMTLERIAEWDEQP